MYAWRRAPPTGVGDLMTLTLVLDDQSDSRGLLRTVLEYVGHDVLDASTGDEALALVASHSPDLVISDIVMPRMDGHEFVRLLRSKPRIRQPAVIFCTATFLSDEAREVARQCGVTHVITKPAEPEEILRVTTAALNTPVAPLPPPSPEAERGHLRTLNHKLVEKMSELDSANRDALRVSLEVERRAGQQAAVAALGQKALAGVTAEELFEEAVAKIMDGLECDVADILELQDDGKMFVVRSVQDATGSVLVNSTAGPDSQPAYTLEVDEPVVSEDLREETRFRPTPAVLESGAVTSASVPIGGPRGRFGVVAAIFRHRHTLSASDMDFLQAMANSLGAALARLEGEARGRDLAAIVENSTDSIISTDLLGRITSWNRAATDIFGWSEKEALGQPITLVVPRATWSTQQMQIETVLSGQSIRNRELRGQRKDGAELTVAITLFPIIGPDGAVVGTAAIGRDVTGAVLLRDQAVVLESRLRQTERMEAVGQLAGGVAHDFNNMLAVIINYAEFLIAGLSEGSLRDDAYEIQRAAERAAGLTRQLLVFSRREVVKPSLVDLNGIVEGARSLLTHSLGEHVELETECLNGLWPVEADPGQLEQVLVNLAVNSRDAMPEGGSLTITTTNRSLRAGSVPPLPAGRYVSLAVTDSGWGMSEEEMEHAFEPFFTTKAKGQGTGLGLATAYGAVERAGGHIDLRSNVGTGTTVTILLPACEGLQRQRPEEIVVPGARTPAGTTVLVVEDEPEVRGLIRRILSGHGYDVLAAPGPVEAIAMTRDRRDARIDLVLTDVVMPKMNGPELIVALRQLRPEIPALFMSGYTDDATVVEGVRDAAIAFLEKPFHAADLLAAVEDAVMAGALVSAGP